MMNRDEHLQWCKSISEELFSKGKYHEAIIAMMVNLMKHPETEYDPKCELGQLGISALTSGDVVYMQSFVRGWR